MSFRNIKKNLEKLLLTSLIPIMISCGGGEDKKEETQAVSSDNTITYATNVQEIKTNSEIANCMDSLEDSVLTLSCFPEDFKNSLTTNTILRFTGNDAVPYGFLGKVQDIGSDSITLDPVPLEDAIEEGTFSIGSSKNSSKFYAANLADGVMEKNSSSSQSKTLYISKCFQNFCVEGSLGYRL